MRLFVGVAPDARARAALFEASRALEAQTQGKFVPDPQMYHVTLAFLGETDQRALAGVREALEESADGARPFSLTVKGLGFFGKPERAIVFGDLERSEALDDLARRVREALTRGGIPFDPKPFRAHITLARQARLSEDWKLCAPPPVSFPARAVTLYHSTRVDGALEYLPIGEFPLR